MKKVNLIYRQRQDGTSIQKVFDTILPYLTTFVRIHKTELPRNGLSVLTILANIFYSITHQKKGSIIHITGVAHYLAYIFHPKKVMTTIHDLNRFINHDDNWITRNLLSLLFINPLKRNKYIVCISEKTKKEFLSIVHYPEEHIFVIPDPISEEYTFSEKSFNVDCPTILHIGTKTNKNLIRTIQALKEIPCELRIIGTISPEIEDALITAKIKYTQLQNLSETELISEYHRCDIVNFPSTYEGFGMPLIEAQAIGRVCLTSNIEPMLSVAGDNGAYFVNPFDVNSIKLGYLRIINDEHLRSVIISNGQKNVKRFQAKEIARQYSDVYNKF